MTLPAALSALFTQRTVAAPSRPKDPASVAARRARHEERCELVARGSRRLRRVDGRWQVRGFDRVWRDFA